MNEPINLSIAATSKRVDIASVVSLTFFNNAGLPRRSRLDLAMGWRDSELGGTGPAILVGKKKYDFGFGNPVGLSRMAYLGRGFYKKKIPLRAIGVFPTWDRLVFAVSKDCGIQAIEDIRRKKYPLRVSTRRRGKLQTTLYVVDEVLKAYGFSLADIERWGGKIMEAASPSSSDRLDAIRSAKADAVFDEGIKSWGPLALNSGMEFLTIDDRVLRKMEEIGFPSATLTKKHYPKMNHDIRTVDFSGWTYFCHADLRSEVAYNMAKAVDLCYRQIPVDHFDKRPMTMREFCRGGEAGQLNIPLHPGAKKYFRERGYL
ncbi:MAG TPA: TAXI family TRAP transporter solute-binding subunit [Candidatus Binatia bacterium]|nr:TAXI family TRAP transporter solute-binding subunit [Candidatus Binatia bacterium]